MMPCGGRRSISSTIAVYRSEANFARTTSLLFSRSVLSGRAAHLHHHHLISVTVAPDLRIENIPALR